MNLSHFLKSALIVIFLFLFENVTFCSDFYVSPNGNDTNPGTKQRPFASIEWAKQEVLKTIQNKKDEDCTVWFSEGIYQVESPVIFNSSDFPENNKVEFKARKKGKVVVSGGIQLKGWKKNNDGIWVVKLSKKMEFRELFINNKRAVRARFPNNDYLRVKKVGEDHRTNFFFEKNDFPMPANPEHVELVVLHDWSISRIAVKEINAEENKLTAVDSIGAKNPEFFNLDHWEPNPRYFLENALEFLDVDYEWFFDSKGNQVYLKLPENQNPESLQIVVPVSNGLIQILGSEKKALKNIHFEGITFQHSTWNIPEMGYCGVQACHFDPRPANDGWSVVPAAVYTEWAENCSFKNCTFENMGGSGIWFSTGSKNCGIINAVVRDISGNGIMIGEGRDRVINGDNWWKSAPEQVALGNTIENCEVTDCGKQFYGAVGIWCGLTAETTIRNNQIYDLPYSGISIGWMWSPVSTPCRQNVIDGNHIHHIMRILSDGGGIYSLGLQPGSKIINNHIHDVTINAGRAESNGMFLDEGTTDVIIGNNLIYKIAKSPLRFHRATKNLVKGNYLFCTSDNPPIRYNSTKEEDIQKVDNKEFNETEPDYQKELEKAIKNWR